MPASSLVFTGTAWGLFFFVRYPGRFGKEAETWQTLVGALKTELVILFFFRFAGYLAEPLVMIMVTHRFLQLFFLCVRDGWQ